MWWSGEHLAEDVPLRPTESATHDATLAELLQLQGLPGSFVYPVFVLRHRFFHNQKTGLVNHDLPFTQCGFYEQLRSPAELIAAMTLDAVLSDHSVPFPRMPMQMVSVKIFPSMYDAPDGIVPLPEADENSIGDHLVVALDFQDGFLGFGNFWGSEWGDRGTGRFSLDYLNRFQQEAWSIRWLTGPSPDWIIGLEDNLGPSNERLRKLFVHPWDEYGDKVWFTLHRGAVDIASRWLIGISDGSVWLQCIAVLPKAEGGPLIVGWMHIHGTLDGPNVEELFVWPPYRERGIGTALVSQALLFASWNPWPHCRWTWHELEADAMVRQRSRPKPHLPKWLQHLAANSGGTVLSEPQLHSLLVRLGRLQVPGGVRVLRTKVNSTVVDTVVDDAQNPTRSVVVKAPQRRTRRTQPRRKNR